MKEKAVYYQSYIQDIGKRASQQDSYLIEKYENNDNVGYMILVCDGVSSSEKGATSSHYAMQTLKAWYKVMQDRLFLMETKEIEKLIAEEIHSIHRTLIERSREVNGDGNFMYGTTLTLCLVVNSRCIIVHIGDSRCYVSYRYEINKVTKDQTQYQQLLDRKARDEKVKLPESKKDILKMQSRLLQCIGFGGQLEIAYYELVLPVEYEILLCTDGFFRRLTEEDLIAFFKAKNSLPGDVRLNKVTELVKRRGERDNITAVLVRKAFEKVG